MWATVEGHWVLIQTPDTLSHILKWLSLSAMIKHISSSSDGMFNVSAGISNLLLAPEVFNTCLLAGW